MVLLVWFQPICPYEPFTANVKKNLGLGLSFWSGILPVVQTVQRLIEQKVCRTGQRSIWSDATNLHVGNGMGRYIRKTSVV